MKIYKQKEEGLTLVEILAALVILGIVLVSFMSFFSQSAKFTTFNNEKLTAVQVAEDVVASVRENNLNYQDLYPEYKIDVVRSDGPTTNLKHAKITVKAVTGTRTNEPGFTTEMYYEME